MLLPGQCLQGLLHPLLDSDGIYLPLPAAVGRPVVLQRQPDVHRGDYQNCMGYAVNKSVYISGDLLGITDLELNNRSTNSQLLYLTRTKSQSWMDINGVDYNSIDTYNSPIFSNQYRVVLRVGYYDLTGVMEILIIMTELIIRGAGETFTIIIGGIKPALVNGLKNPQVIIQGEYPILPVLQTHTITHGIYLTKIILL